MMYNTTENDLVQNTDLMKLRKRIYSIESMNLHKKIPQSDPEMVEKIIKEIKQFVEFKEVD